MRSVEQFRSNKLSGIQALRGLAAVTVVLFHAARHIDKDHGAPGLMSLFRAGHAGVDLFFVLSGFIILFVHHRDLGVAHRLRNYGMRRFERVMPLYWLALALTVTMSVVSRHPLPPTTELLWSASLLPTPHEPLLGIAWTLQCEVVFYLFFALLILNRGLGRIAMGGWLAGVLVAAVFPLAGYPATAVFNVFGVEFFIGMAAAWLVLRGRITAPRLVAALGAAGFLTVAAVESAGLLNGFGTVARFAYGTPAGLLIAGLAAAERSDSLVAPAWLAYLGGASYSIYLFQFIFIGIAWQAWLKLEMGSHLPDWACLAVLAASATLGGLIVSALVEHPLLRAMRGRRRPVPDMGQRSATRP